MTKKEFKKALLRGQGRCILAVREDPDKYRDLVMWTCQRRIAFDTQCEGARTWFVYQMVNCYDDVQPFIKAAAQSLDKCRSNGDWTIFSLSELLWFFAVDGSRVARAALERKYRQLYGSLMARKRRKSGVFPELDDFASLCVIMAEDRRSFLKIAADLGRLYRMNPIYDGFDFDWLYETKGKPRLSGLKKAAENEEDLTCYLETQQAYDQECMERRKKIHTPPRKGIALSAWLALKAAPETVLEYAKAYQEEPDPEKRAEALSAFRRCPYPCDPVPILTDLESECQALQDAAWAALENIRHPAVRAFALENLENRPLDVLPLITKNYQPKDAELLERLVTSIPVDFYEQTGWHGAQISILEMKNDGLKAPPGLLMHIYETTCCSCCRENVLRQMGKRRLLTQRILEECLYDSNDEIRTYAKRCLKRRKTN